MPSFHEKLLVLRLNRLGQLPVSLYSTEHLANIGFKVIALEYGNSSPSKVSEMPFELVRWETPWVNRFPQKLRPVLNWSATLYQLFRTCRNGGKPRLVLAHGISEQVLAFFLKLFLKIPYGVDVHEAYEKRDLKPFGWNRILFALEGCALRSAEFLIFPQVERARTYLERYHLRTPIRIVYNCPPKQKASRSDGLRRQLGIPPDHVVMGYLGGLGEENCLEEGIWATARISSLSFIIWGWGDSHYIQRLRRLAINLGVSDRVYILGELKEDKWEKLSTCDLTYCLYRPTLLRLRYAATASNKLMESLAMGVPVLTSQTADFEFIIHTYNVGRTTQLDADSIANTLNIFVQDKAGRIEQSQNARRLHQRLYHYESQFRLVAESLQSSLSTSEFIARSNEGTVTLNESEAA